MSDALKMLFWNEAPFDYEPDPDSKYWLITFSLHFADLTGVESWYLTREQGELTQDLSLAQRFKGKWLVMLMCWRYNKHWKEATS